MEIDQYEDWNKGVGRWGQKDNLETCLYDFKMSADHKPCSTRKSMIGQIHKSFRH